MYQSILYILFFISPLSLWNPTLGPACSSYFHAYIICYDLWRSYHHTLYSARYGCIGIKRYSRLEAPLKIKTKIRMLGYSPLILESAVKAEWEKPRLCLCQFSYRCSESTLSYKGKYQNTKYCTNNRNGFVKIIFNRNDRNSKIKNSPYDPRRISPGKSLSPLGRFESLRYVRKRSFRLTRTVDRGKNVKLPHTRD